MRRRSVIESRVPSRKAVPSSTNSAQGEVADEIAASVQVPRVAPIAGPRLGCSVRVGARGFGAASECHREQQYASKHGRNGDHPTGGVYATLLAHDAESRADAGNYRGRWRLSSWPQCLDGGRRSVTAVIPGRGQRPRQPVAD